MKRPFLTRKNVRDVVILLCAVSALFFSVTGARIALAFILLAVGTFVHFVSKGILIRNETLSTRGMYTVVRHPYYLANYLIDTSFCLMSGNNYLLLLYPFLFHWSYGPTFRQEEKLLAQKHPDSSFTYMFSTPPVFPDRFSMRHVNRLFDGFSFQRISGKEVARIIRFYGAALLLLLLHSIDMRTFSAEMYSRQPDPYVVALLGLAIMLFAASIFVLRKSERESS